MYPECIYIYSVTNILIWSFYWRSAIACLIKFLDVILTVSCLCWFYWSFTCTLSEMMNKKMSNLFSILSAMLHDIIKTYHKIYWVTNIWGSTKCYPPHLQPDSASSYICNQIDYMICFDNHKLCGYLKESYLNTVFNPNDSHLCNYFDEDEFIACNKNTTSHLNILKMNIRSLPKAQWGTEMFYKCIGK